MSMKPNLKETSAKLIQAINKLPEGLKKYKKLLHLQGYDGFTIHDPSKKMRFQYEFPDSNNWEDFFNAHGPKYCKYFLSAYNQALGRTQWKKVKYAMNCAASLTNSRRYEPAFRYSPPS